MSTITIPAQIVPHARDGALYLLGLACNEIGNQTDCAPPDLEGPLQRFDTLRGLLDALAVEGPARVDEAYRPTLLDALWEDAAVTIGMRDTNASEGYRGTALKHAVEVEDVTGFIAALSAQTWEGE
jgi:hypothetical protein